MTTAETQARINRALVPAFAETAAMAWLRNAAKQLDRIEANERAQGWELVEAEAQRAGRPL